MVAEITRLRRERATYQGAWVADLPGIVEWAVGVAIARHGDVSPCYKCRKWENSFVNEMPGLLSFWYNDNQDSTHVLKIKIEEGKYYAV